MSDAHGVARDQLRAFIERIERLEEEKKTIADDIKDVYGEAKAMGFDTVIMKRVVALRKKDEQKRMEEEAVLDTYLHALGMIAQPDFFEETLAETYTSVGSGRGSAAPLRFQPETATEVPAQDGKGTALGESHGGKSNAAAHPVSEQELAEIVLNDGTATGEIANEVVTVVGTESGTVADPELLGGVAGTCSGIKCGENRTGTESETSGDSVERHATNSQSDDGAVAAVKGKARLANVADVEPSSSGQIDPNEDREEGHSLDGNADANAGGGHVNAQQNAAQHQAGALVKHAPATKPLRPLCRNPGEHCGGYGSNHCNSCIRASRESEVAA